MLHLLAIAREFNLPLEIEAFERLGESTPVIGNLIPGGSYAALDLYKAGGIALVLRELAAGGLLHLNEQSVDGRTMGEIAAQANERAGQDVIRPSTLCSFRCSRPPAASSRNTSAMPPAL
ncbi:MAG: dihydroxy-acid dehydratase [Candidatus Limnocylindrus sp.]